MKQRQLWVWGGVLVLLLGVFYWFAVPPLERAFAPQVTVVALRTSPDHYLNQVVEIHGDLRYFRTSICQTPGIEGVLLADTPDLWPQGETIHLQAENSFPATAIELRRGLDLMPLQFSDQSSNVIVWGRLRSQNIESAPCTGSVSSTRFLYFDIERIQFPDGRVLP